MEAQLKCACKTLMKYIAFQQILSSPADSRHSQTFPVELLYAVYCKLQDSPELSCFSTFQLDEKMKDEAAVSSSVPAWRNLLLLTLTNSILVVMCSFYSWPNVFTSSVLALIMCYQNEACTAKSFFFCWIGCSKPLFWKFHVFQVF